MRMPLRKRPEWARTIRRTAAVALAGGVATAAASSLEPAEARRSSTPGLPSIESLTLLQVQSTFRHGARTPMEDIGDAPVKWLPSEQRAYAAGREGKCGKLSVLYSGSGEGVDPLELFVGRADRYASGGGLNGGGGGGILTNVGLQQANALGEALRARYVDTRAKTSTQVGRSQLLPRTWGAARRLVSTRSTLVERTVFTAGGVLAGMYPQEAEAGELAAEVELNVPRGSHGAEEYMVINTELCPRLRELFRQGQRLSAANLDARQRAAIAQVEEGAEHDSWFVGAAEWKLIAYRDQLACRRAEGKHVPPHVVQVEDALDRGAAVQMHDIFEGGAAHVPGGDAARDATRTQALRLGIGRMVTHILHTLDRPDGKLHLYSGHDWTVGPLLMCLCRRDEPLLSTWPPFCAEVAVELWSAPSADASQPTAYWPARGAAPHAHAGARYVRVLYNGTPLDLPCSAEGQQLCRLDDFKAALAPYCCECFESECASANTRGSGWGSKRY